MQKGKGRDFTNLPCFADSNAAHMPYNDNDGCSITYIFHDDGLYTLTKHHHKGAGIEFEPNRYLASVGEVEVMIGLIHGNRYCLEDEYKDPSGIPIVEKGTVYPFYLESKLHTYEDNEGCSHKHLISGVRAKGDNTARLFIECDYKDLAEKTKEFKQAINDLENDYDSWKHAFNTPAYKFELYQHKFQGKMPKLYMAMIAEKMGFKVPILHAFHQQV